MIESPCQLCGQLAPLQLSHVLPSFVLKWLKETGGPIRHSGNINLRIQDGAKEKWLCSACENLFSGWETKFANTIFHPLNTSGLPAIAYGEWLLKFCTSVSWRSLLYVKEKAPLAHLSPAQQTKAESALQVWAEYLRDERPHPGAFEQHLVPFGPITEDIGIAFPPNINRYLLRNAEIDVGASASAAFVYSKLGRVGILGFIDLERPKHWSDTRIRLRGGSIQRPPYRLPVQFGKYLSDRAGRVWDVLEKMSEPQKQKVDAHVRANIETFARSPFLQAMQYDVDLFGDAAFRRE